MTDDASGYDPIEETYHASFEWPGAKPPSVALVEAMAAVTDTDPTTIAPLYEVVDPDALDDLFAHRPPGSAGFDGVVELLFCDHKVTIYGSGEIVIDLSET